ncbi:MAG: hypothetical protein IPL39_01280 [Opitutaceae bacterium]|nr:hypothetical protein [Opitutaceae bacterium]
MLILSVVGVLAHAPTALASAPASVRWICSTEADRWHEKTVEPVALGTPASDHRVVLDPSQTFQTIDGFGGCFNELGWEALTSLPDDRREAALKELFSPAGASFTLGRASIGANDFSPGWYSLNETSGDYAMKDFSIARTRECLIPFIKAAMHYQPKLGIWASPWCPPSWMTSNGRYRQGNMKGDPQRSPHTRSIFPSSSRPGAPRASISTRSIRKTRWPSTPTSIPSACGRPTRSTSSSATTSCPSFAATKSTSRSGSARLRMRTSRNTSTRCSATPRPRLESLALATNTAARKRSSPPTKSIPARSSPRRRPNAMAAAIPGTKRCSPSVI